MIKPGSVLVFLVALILALAWSLNRTDLHAQTQETHRAKTKVYIGLPECDHGESNWSIDEAHPDHVILVCWFDAAGPAPKKEPEPDPEVE